MSLHTKLHSMVTIPHNFVEEKKNVRLFSESNQPVPTKGVFITKEALLTFSGSCVVISITWKFLAFTIPQIKDSIWIPIILSFLIGFFIYYISIEDSMTKKDKIISFILSLINSIFLAASALGIDGTI